MQEICTSCGDTKILKNSQTFEKVIAMPAINPAFCVKTHHELPKVSEEQIRERGAEILQNADAGIQTAVVGSDGRLRSVIGLNGCRYLPDADPDPLEEILREVLDSPSEGPK